MGGNPNEPQLTAARLQCEELALDAHLGRMINTIDEARLLLKVQDNRLAASKDLLNGDVSSRSLIRHNHS